MSERGSDALGRPRQPAPPPRAQGQAGGTGSALDTVMRVMRRRWPIFIACVVITAAAALFVSLREDKKYEATASILFRGSGFDESLFGPAFSSSDDPARATATNVELVSLGVVADRAARRLRIAGLSGSDISSMIDVKANDKSDIARVAATAKQVGLARRIANTFADEYVSFRRNSEVSQVRQARRQVNRSLNALSPADQAGARGRSLRRRADQLASFETLRTGDAEVVQRATDASQVAPTPRRGLAVGLMLGLFLGVGLVFLLERLNRRLRDEEEVESVLGLPVLARIPNRSARGSGGDLHGHDPEAFGMLRANLRYFNVDRPISSILVTSPDPGDGKSTVSWNVALAQAHVGQSVLVIEADLRVPRLGERLALSSGSGLSLLLAGIDSVEEATSRVRVESVEFDVIPAGPVPPNPAEMIESERMRDLLETAGERYDFVVVDAPPAVVVADAIPLMSKVSGVIVVARLKHTTKAAAQALRQRLHQLRAPVLGVVVNGSRVPKAPYGAPSDEFPRHRTAEVRAAP